MATQPITLEGADVGEAMRAVFMQLVELRCEAARISDRGLKPPQSLHDRIARLVDLDKRLSDAVDGKQP